MKDFDPIVEIRNCASILDAGAWPNFHDAVVYSLKFWRGDMRPDDDVWVGPVIEASLELDALEFPYVVDLRFHDCRDVRLAAFNHNNDICALSFYFEHRGYYQDGVTPLMPAVRVIFEGFADQQPMLEFRCFHVEAVGRREITAPPKDGSE